MKLAALRKSPTIYELLCQYNKREEATVRLASGAVEKLDEVQVDFAFSFSDFSCTEKFIVLGTESPYNLIIGISWLD